VKQSQFCLLYIVFSSNIQFSFHLAGKSRIKLRSKCYSSAIDLHRFMCFWAPQTHNNPPWHLEYANAHISSFDRVRNRRELNASLKGTTLGDAEEDVDDTLKWIKRNKKKERELAKKRQHDLENRDKEALGEYTERLSILLVTFDQLAYDFIT